MTNEPTIETRAEYTVPLLTLGHLEQFLAELAAWPRDTEVVVQPYYGQRDQLEAVRIIAVMRGAR